MTYRIDFKEAAQADLVALAKSEPKAFLKSTGIDRGTEDSSSYRHW